MAQVIEINNLQDLETYQLAWSRLFNETPNATFFQTYDWLVRYWQHFGQEHDLRVLVVEAAGEVVGILPLCVRVEQRRVGQVRTLCYPLDEWGTRFGPIGPNPSATLALAMKHIANSPRDWDRVELNWVEHDTADRGRTQRAMELAGWNAETEVTGSTSLLDLPESWDEFLAGLSQKMRGDIRRVLRRIGDRADVEYVRYRSQPARNGGGDPAWELYEECETVTRNSWQHSAEQGNTMCHDDYQAFYRETHEAAARLGMVDINILRINGKPAAFSYNYVHDGQIFGLRMGYDASVTNSQGIGFLLTVLCLKDCIERGDRCFDLGPGDQLFKQRVRTQVVDTWAVRHTPLASLKGQVLRLGNWLRPEQPEVALK